MFDTCERASFSSFLVHWIRENVGALDMIIRDP